MHGKPSGAREPPCIEAPAPPTGTQPADHTESLSPKGKAMAIMGIAAVSTFYAAIAAGLVPPPVKFGRKSLWLNSELQAAIEAAKRRRDGEPRAAKSRRACEQPQDHPARLV